MVVTNRFKVGESIFYNFVPESRQPIGADYTSTYRLLDKDNAEVNSGNCAKSGDSTKFELRIDTTVTLTLLGRYNLEVYVLNTTSGQRELILGEIEVFK